jgi:PIN domain nuclease of toxin-antitoxin system
MKHVLLDTHTWAWTLAADPRLSTNAATTIENAHAVFVSPISFFEIGQKVRLGKWPEMETIAQNLPALLEQQGGFAAQLSPDICLHASLRDWAHRDPFDRFLASTAELLSLPLISKDSVFDELQGIQRVW